MSGQGAQTVGMGQDLFDNLPVYQAYVQRANQVLGYDLMADVCGNANRIQQTAFAQPAIMTMSVGIYQALFEGLSQPNYLLGLSLGEYSALTAAQIFNFEQSVAILADRGRYMQDAGETQPGKMVAVMSDNQSQIVNLLTQLQAQGKRVYPANFNTFSQLVIGGVATDVDVAVEQLSQLGISRMVELPVAGAFHTPLLATAAEKLKQRLSHEKVMASDKIVFSNTTGQPFSGVLPTLEKQMTHPTYFAQALQAMIDQGVDTLIELGPSDTLSKFAKKVVGKEIKRYAVNDLVSFQQVRTLLLTEGK
nr:ACP S-malonyltransferase [Weissella diestrammenae]